MQPGAVRKIVSVHARVGAMLAAMALSLLVVACSGSSGGGDATGSAPDTGSATGTPPAPDPVPASCALGIVAPGVPPAVARTGNPAQLSLLAGHPHDFDGQGTDASFGTPLGIVEDSHGNLFVADRGSQTIRRITPAGVVSTFAGTPFVAGWADGPGSSARFFGPSGLAIDGFDNLYVIEIDNNTVRRIAPDGTVSTLAGGAFLAGYADGAGAAARFYSATGLAVDAGGTLYVADTRNRVIRTVSQAGVVSTLAGQPGAYGTADGAGAAARFQGPTGLAVNAAGVVYVADGSAIRRIAPDGTVSTVAGSATESGTDDGTGAAARFTYPFSVAIEPSGDLLVTDLYAATVRRVTPAGVVTTVAGLAGNTGHVDGAGTAARFWRPVGVAVDQTGAAWVTDQYGDAGTVRRIAPNGTVSTFAGALSTSGYADGKGRAAYFDGAVSLGADAGGTVFVADYYNGLIRAVASDGTVRTVAGNPQRKGSADGVGAAASFTGPRGLAVDGAGTVFVGDNDTIRKVTAAGVVSTVIGSPGVEGATDGHCAVARLGAVRTLALDGSGTLYALAGNAIRKISPAGVVSTLVGPTPDLQNASALAADAAGHVYFAAGDVIHRIAPDGTRSVLAGNPALGRVATDGTGAGASFVDVYSLTADREGNLYVGERGRLRKVTPAGEVRTIVGVVSAVQPFPPLVFIPGALPVPATVAGSGSLAVSGTTLYATHGNAVIQVTDVP